MEKPRRQVPHFDHAHVDRLASIFGMALGQGGALSALELNRG